MSDVGTETRRERRKPSEAEKCPECGAADKTTVDSREGASKFRCRRCGHEWWQPLSKSDTFGEREDSTND